MAACQKPAEGELVLYPPRLAREAAVEFLLHVLPQLTGDERLIAAVVHGSVKVEVPAVDPVSQNFVHAGLWHGGAALPVCQAIGVRQRHDLVNRVLAGRVAFVHARDDWSHIRVGGDGPLAVLPGYVPVAQWGVGGPD